MGDGQLYCGKITNVDPLNRSYSVDFKYTPRLVQALPARDRRPFFERDVRDWSVEDVGEWIKWAGFGQYKQLFARNKIDGHALLRLNPSSLGRLGNPTPGVRPFHIKILLRRINELKQGFGKEQYKKRLRDYNAKEQQGNVNSMGAGDDGTGGVGPDGRVPGKHKGYMDRLSGRPGPGGYPARRAAAGGGIAGKQWREYKPPKFPQPKSFSEFVRRMVPSLRQRYVSNLEEWGMHDEADNFARFGTHKVAYDGLVPQARPKTQEDFDRESEIVGMVRDAIAAGQSVDEIQKRIESSQKTPEKKSKRPSRARKGKPSPTLQQERSARRLAGKRYSKPKDMSELQKGMRVRVTVPGYETRKYSGSVQRKFKARGTNAPRVEVQFDEDGEFDRVPIDAIEIDNMGAPAAEILYVEDEDYDQGEILQDGAGDDGYGLEAEWQRGSEI